MKKCCRIFLTFLSIIISIIVYLQWGQNSEICSTSIESFKNGYCENISVVANKVYISDKQKYAEIIIQKSIDNTWKEIKFSYDFREYPNDLCIDVYRNHYFYKHGKKYFRIIYSQDTKYDYKYNIKENPEKFNINIIEY